MNLVELNIDSIPLGQPLPFALRGATGALLAQKGFVIRTPEDLRVLMARGLTLNVDTDESGDSFRAFRAQLQNMLLSDKPLREIATMTMQAEVSASADSGPMGTPDWREWQLRLTQLLRSPEADDFLPRFLDMHLALDTYCRQSPDAALLFLVQMSAEETRFYSATHAMLVTCICSIVARETLRWPDPAIASLGRAALSMNVGMSHLQDELAQQVTPLRQQQIAEIDAHAERSVRMLQNAGINDPLWLEAVKGHHLRAPGRLSEKSLGGQMARLIQRADIFGARIAPRATRDPMSVTSAMQASYYDEIRAVDEAGSALVKTLGIYPPGAWVRLASEECGIVLRRGANAATPRVAVLLNRSGMPTGEPIPRDTSVATWKIVGTLTHKEVRVRPPLERLLSLA